MERQYQQLESPLNFYVYFAEFFLTKTYVAPNLFDFDTMKDFFSMGILANRKVSCEIKGDYILNTNLKNSQRKNPNAFLIEENSGETVPIILNRNLEYLLGNDVVRIADPVVEYETNILPYLVSFLVSVKDNDLILPTYPKLMSFKEKTSIYLGEKVIGESPVKLFSNSDLIFV